MYAYFTSTEYLSEKFDTVNETLQDAIESNIFPIKSDELGEYIIVEVAETGDYEDRIDGEHIIELLINDAWSNMGDVAEDYLYKVNINDFNEKLNEFWKEYKEKNNIGNLYLSKSGTRKLYRAYLCRDKDRKHLVYYKEER